jgi:hypothetical protein
MAKYNNGQMGLGALANPNAVFKRKYRWTFKLNTPCGEIPETIVKLASRPNLSIEETEINFLHGKMWIPGKASWETITVTYYDVVSGSADVVNLYNWLSSVYQFDKPNMLNQSSKRGSGFSGVLATNATGYAANASLSLYDGCGTEMEKWELGHVWPQSINFGELDYSSSEEVTVELTLRYSEVNYTKSCGKPFVGCSCAGC